MPELPEVEVNKRSLWKHIEGARFLLPILVRDDILKIHSPSLSLDDFNHAIIINLNRRGKYLILTLRNVKDVEMLLIIHFRMTGKLLYSRSSELDDSLKKHSHILFPLIKRNEEAGMLIWHDVRRFGTVELITAEDFINSSHTIKKLGPEPFSDDFNSAYCLQMAKRHAKLKLPAFFLNQSVVAGLGNIYLNEALFLAQLHPDLLASQLVDSEFDELIKIFRAILQRSINRGGTSFRDYKDADGQSGNNQQLLSVYSRHNQACVRCRSTLQSLSSNGRRIVFCPSCQAYRSRAHHRKKGKQRMLFLASGYSSRMDSQKSSVRAFSYEKGKGFESLDQDFGNLEDLSYIIHDISTTKVYGVQEGASSSAVMIDLSKQAENTNLAELIGASGPCHICQSGSYVFTANYGSGSLSILKQEASMLNYLREIQHEGEGPNRDRQSSAHTHWVGVSADEKYLFAVDLGCDAIFSYSLEELVEKASNDEKIEAKSIFYFPPGTGPRHLVLSPDQKHAYVAGELSAEIFALSYKNGEFELIEKHDVSTKPSSDSFSSDEIAPAAIRMTQNGRHVLISVRGTDQLWSFKRDENSGKLTFSDQKHVVGIWPRDFNLLSDDATIIVANERSHSLNVLYLNAETGLLEASEDSIRMAAPSCILPQ